MSDDKSVTFRDFAGALMGGDADAAAGVLCSLLGVDAEVAKRATGFFQQQMTSGGPEFMQKAMGMRYVVEAKDGDKLVGLLGDCFQLDEAAAASAAKHLLAHYA
jgi:hypothetical protein